MNCFISFLAIFLMLMVSPLISSFKAAPSFRARPNTIHDRLSMKDQNVFKSSMKKVIASTIISVSCFGSPSFNEHDQIANAVTPSTTSSSSSAALEQSIVKLESAETRADLVQGLADLFEASGSQTLRARTKYKYVSLCVA